MTTTTTRTVAACLTAAMLSLLPPPAPAQVVTYTDELTYVVDLLTLGADYFQEGFEDDVEWGDTRGGALPPSVTSLGLTWASNNPPTGKVATGGGAARSGLYGVYSLPHGDATGGQESPLRDGFVATRAGFGPGALIGIGGWFRTNTPPAAVRFVIDGVEHTFADPSVTNGHKFFGVIVPGGIDTFEVYETEGAVGEQRYIFADDFTFAATGLGTAPVADDRTLATDEDVAIPVTLTGTDPDGDPLTFSLLSSPLHGSLTGPPPDLTYTPDPNFHGLDSFQFTVNDGALGRPDSAPGTVDITVGPINDPPVLDPIGDRVGAAGEPLIFKATATDGDVPADTLVFSLDPGAPAGAAIGGASGVFTWTPAAGAGHGPFTVTVRVTDDGTPPRSAAETISITVDNPPIAADDAYGTAEDVPLAVVAPGVLGNDDDLDGDPLSAVLVTGPALGTLDLSADGGFVYTPSANYNGPDAFTYRVNDGVVASDLATVTITVADVNDPPVAVGDSERTSEDTPLVVPAPGVLGNDTDVESFVLTAVLDSPPAHGTLALDPDGGFTYTPDPDYAGPDAFSYHAHDGASASNVAPVDITVDAVNDLPVAADDAWATPQSTALDVAAPGVLGNDTDVDSAVLTAVLDAGPAHGALTLNADGSFGYTPDAGFAGADAFTYHANDGTPAAPADSNVATVHLDVTAGSASPVAVDDSYAVVEDTQLVVAAPGVLGNDTSPGGGALGAVLDTAPMHGDLVLNADGSLAYTPAADYSGPDEFSYRAGDAVGESNVATVSIDVMPVNDAPIAHDDGYVALENTPLEVAAPGVSGNDVDVDVDPLTATVDVPPLHGALLLNADGSLTYAPADDYTGPDGFAYHTDDGVADSNAATVSIDVRSVNGEPVAADDDYVTEEDITLVVEAPGLLGNDTDPEGDALTAALDAGPMHGVLTLRADGGFRYTPEAYHHGSDAFSYHASDGSAESSIATVSIESTPANDAPVAVDKAYLTDQDTVLIVAAPGLLDNDTDPDGDALTAALDTDPSHGTLVLDPDGSFSYSPAPGYSGADAFTYRASDGSADSGVATVRIDVHPTE